MTLTRSIVAGISFLLTFAILFAWISSTAATGNFVLSDKIILYSVEGTLWYTRNDDGGLIADGPIKHGDKISALAPKGQTSLDYKYVSKPPYTLLILPYWMMLVVFVPLSFLFPFRILRKRIAYGKCPNCGYDLRASPHRCPECGTPIARDGTAA